MTDVVLPRVARRPTPKQLEALFLLSRGRHLLRAEARMGLAPRSLTHRITRLRVVSGRTSHAALVYWGLTELYIESYEKRYLPPLKQKHLDVLQLLVLDFSPRQAAQKLHRSYWGVEELLREARAGVKARTTAQVVAIAYAEDWIS